VTGPRVFGIALDSQRSLIIMAAIFLALGSVGVALLRRGRFGRQLIALRDSEAAYAMLGGNLLLAKVAVFALAAGLAGLGGALYAMQQQSILPAQFSFQAGLPLFLIAVVGGLSSVGTGLFTGTALIGPISGLNEVAAGLTNFTALLPGLAGIGLGRSPAGVLPLLREEFTPVARRAALRFGLLGVVAALWVLRLTGVVNGWVLFWGTAIIAVGVQLYAKATDQGTAPATAARSASAPAGGAHRKRTSAPAAAGPGQDFPADTPDVPVEWWGLRRPWRDDDEEVLDRAVARG
jgi:branched-chain amino acid transport system permease protein